MENRLKALEERIDALEQRLKSVMKIKLDEAEIALVDAFSKPMRKELNMENTKRTAKEMLIY